MNKTIIGTGIFNLDTIVVREYPQWPALRPLTDKVALEEVGGTCGNVMCMLARLGWDAKPLVCLDDSPEGLKVAEVFNHILFHIARILLGLFPANEKTISIC